MRAGVGIDSLRQALALTGVQVTALATIAERAAALQPLATELGLPLRIVDATGIVTPTQSARVQARFATGSVAEATALVAAGPKARITVLRVATADGMATCAVAVAEGVT